ISDIIRKHEVGFTNEVEEKIGDINEYRLQGDCIRIECISAEQLDKLMTVTTFLDEAVTVSLPWTGSQKTMEKARVADNKSVRYNKVVVTGVSDQWEDDHLKEEAGADFFRRIRRRVDVHSRIQQQWYSGTSTTHRIESSSATGATRQDRTSRTRCNVIAV